jgi:transcriptional regulator GlxA family with amidase domain
LPKRLAAARQRLEQTNETLDKIAAETGFGSSINLRRIFERQFTSPPANIVSASTAAKWRKVILICHLRQTAADLQ